MNKTSATHQEELRDPALSGLYRQHSQAEPTDALDAAILAKARQAVEKPARKSSWWKRFSAPFALAATVVLAVLVSFNVNKEQPEFVPPPVPVEQTPAPVETRQLIPAAPPLADKPKTKSADRNKAAEAVKAESAKPVARIEKKDRREVLPAPFPATPAVIPERAARPKARIATEESTIPDATPPASHASAPEKSRARISAGAQALPKATTTPSPEIWIENIRKLRREGKMADAAQSLAEFRRAYPDYKLPEDLQ